MPVDSYDAFSTIPMLSWNILGCTLSPFWPHSRGWDMIDTPYVEVTERLCREEASGISRPSSDSRVLKRILSTFDSELTVSQEDLVKDATVVAFSAGADTTQAPLLTIFAAMTHFPEVQRKALEEINDLLNSKDDVKLEKKFDAPRFPTFDDLQMLTYSQAVVWELLRYLLAVRVAIPTSLHTLAIMQNPEHFPEPAKFDPDRFINEYGQLNEALVDIVRLSFGFGRRVYSSELNVRICPGRGFAWDTIWINLVSTLRAFNILPVKDEFGRDVLPRLELEPMIITFVVSETYQMLKYLTDEDVPHGFYRKLRAFECTITPRSKEIDLCVQEYN
ncbi:hypothetical protein ONZ45_g1896 [Pleurotus djamor]|nr:hypothetical protein ONZ45_g1896 [Pleurotus djamor]